LIPFVEERFNTEYRYGMVGGPEFNSTVVEVDSGAEYINANWSMGMGRWTTSNDLYSKAELKALIAFFNNRRGQAVGFRFKAWEDFEVGLSGSSPEGICKVETWGTQLYKRYYSGSVYVDKIIQKPVNNAAFILSAGTVDFATGIVTGGSGTTTWVGEFDKPARFTTDRFDCEFMAFRDTDGERLFQVTGLGIKEIRLPTV
jgi:uncharacterized protein (TIGR02217 family)